ncbi:MAG: DRTGG domain-containing protein, partial [Chloroflexota bacterium]|nr:DRTGG domain-containing protein [Chloroflexota bacterium]
GLALHGIPLLGVLPYRPILSSPTLGMVLEGVHGRVINTGPDLDRVIGGVAVGAMEPHHMLDRMGPCTLVIVASDRREAILELAAAYVASRSCVDVDDQPKTGPGATPGAVDPRNGKVLGLVLTGGYEPGAEVLAVLRNAGMFAASVDEDTYTVASQVQGLLVKTHAADTGKIELIKEMVWEHLKMDRVLEVASEPRFA